jgi:hypothetical protein
MAIDLNSIKKETVIRAPRMVLIGVEKIGKTTFACGSRVENGIVVETGLNSPVVIPIKGEEGADSLNVAQFPVCKSYDDVMDAIESLLGEHDYKTVIIDSASALEPLIWDAVCKIAKVDSIEKVGGGYGKGYAEAASLSRNMLAGLDALRNERGMSVIIIGHVKVKRFDDPGGDSYDQYQFDAHDKVANLIYRWSDIILFANTKVVVAKEDVGFGKDKKRGIDTTGGRRFLYTQKRPSHPGGGRGYFGQLPYEIPLDWASFESAVSDIIDKKYKGAENHE